MFYRLNAGQRRADSVLILRATTTSRKVIVRCLLPAVLVIVATGWIAAAPAAAADAKVSGFKSKKIVLGKSIAGISIPGKTRQLKSSFGQGKQCRKTKQTISVLMGPQKLLECVAPLRSDRPFVLASGHVGKRGDLIGVVSACGYSSKAIDHLNCRGGLGEMTIDPGGYKLGYPLSAMGQLSNSFLDATLEPIKSTPAQGANQVAWPTKVLARQYRHNMTQLFFAPTNGELMSVVMRWVPWRDFRPSSNAIVLGERMAGLKLGDSLAEMKKRISSKESFGRFSFCGRYSGSRRWCSIKNTELGPVFDAVTHKGRVVYLRSECQSLKLAGYALLLGVKNVENTGTSMPCAEDKVNMPIVPIFAKLGQSLPQVEAKLAGFTKLDSQLSVPEGIGSSLHPTYLDDFFNVSLIFDSNQSETIFFRDSATSRTILQFSSSGRLYKVTIGALK